MTDSLIEILWIAFTFFSLGMRVERLLWKRKGARGMKEEQP